MGKLKKVKNTAVKKIVVVSKENKITKPKMAEKKTVKKKIRKTLGLKSPKKSSVKLSKNVHDKLVEENASIELTKKSKMLEATKEQKIQQKQTGVAAAEEQAKKKFRGHKRKQSPSETETDQVPSRFVLNKKEASKKIKQDETDSEVKKPEKKSKKRPNGLKGKQRATRAEKKHRALAAKFKINEDTVRSAFKAVQKLLEEKANKQNSLFDEEQPIFLQIVAMKIPQCPARVARLPLKHSLFSDSSEICLIAPDVKHISVKETDQVADYYEKFLALKNVKNIKTVLPLYQLKTDYVEYEMKRRLVGLYDAFLVDGRVSGRVTSILGKIFYDKRKLPTPIKLDASNLKEAIDKALSKTFFRLHAKGDSFLVQISHSNMDEDKQVANFWAVVSSLEKEFPGGLKNIRRLQLKGSTTMSVPVYLTLKKKNEVETPVINPKRPKAFVPVTDEISTKYNSEVTVFPTGEVVTKPLGKKGELLAEEDSDDEVDDVLLNEEDDGYVENKRKATKKMQLIKSVKQVQKTQEKDETEENGEYTKEELSYLQEMGDDKKKVKRNKKQRGRGKQNGIKKVTKAKAKRRGQ